MVEDANKSVKKTLLLGSLQKERPKPSKPNAIAPGLMVNEDLRLERPINKGGMATVWEAYNVKLHAAAAVKSIEDHLVQSQPELLQRFRREARIAAQLRNPHTARTLDYGSLPDGTPFIIMELLVGESLQAHLKRHHMLSIEHTALILSQTAQALDEAHEIGIVHRDIKPANLFLQEDTDYELFVKLLDFGIAKNIHVPTLSQSVDRHTLLGSPRYMSPEQLTSVVDWRADLWSLAAIAYRCLAGMAPFDGPSITQVAQALRHHRYPPITSKRPELPAELDDWFAQAFHEDIAKRHQSGRELADSFRAIVEGEHARPAAISPHDAVTLEDGPPPSVSEALNRLSEASGTHIPLKRSRFPLIAALALVLLGGIGAYVAFGGNSTAAPDGVDANQANTGAATSPAPSEPAASAAPSPSGQPSASTSATTSAAHAASAPPPRAPSSADGADEPEPAATDEPPQLGSDLLGTRE